MTRDKARSMITFFLSAVLFTSVAAASSCPATVSEYLTSVDKTVDCSSSIKACGTGSATGNAASSSCCFYVGGQSVSFSEALTSDQAGDLPIVGSTTCQKSDRSSGSGGTGGSSGGGTGGSSGGGTSSKTVTGGGCIGLSTTCKGSKVFDIVKQRYSFVHGGRPMTRDVLCIDTNSSQICLTPTHVVTLADQSQTMNELCQKRECSKRREPVFNFWAQNPDEVIECDVFGITQKVDNRVLAAFAAMNNIIPAPRTNWALLRIFHL
jgi:hypothetical protein